ncbi:MAG TPA: phosphoribosylaminoimidazolesuccinocarboxamide synthase [Fimbriimonadaceae bacterium]|nr:phosphoribosylaminoimidazolesuccinocarboxamide synthase [Fimbriimonadaceae bacterium]
MSELLHTALPGLPPPKVGKVREVYDLGDALLIVATDRISAFDVVMANGIPDKGRILSQMSAFWFDELAPVCPHHVISTDDDAVAARLESPRPELKGRATLAKKAKPLEIECVARGYIAGSLFKQYRSEGGKILGFDLPDGMVDSDRLGEPIFSPATKAKEGHDENIDFVRACDIVGRETAEKVRDWTLELYRRAAAHCAAAGIILADTKFEFGETDEGIIWIDEALTPDSSRFWDASLYSPGRSQPSYDKQFVRDYLETLDWDKRPPGPVLPPDIVAKTRAKYVEAFERITGRAF